MCKFILEKILALPIKIIILKHKNMRCTKFILPIIGLFLSIQCSTHKKTLLADEKIIIIGSNKVDCIGVVKMKCLQTKEKPSDNWSNFYSNIEGFNYQSGYEYVLQIKTEKVENPPADASSIKYTLIKEISKTKK